MAAGDVDANGADDDEDDDDEYGGDGGGGPMASGRYGGGAANGAAAAAGMLERLRTQQAETEAALEKARAAEAEAEADGGSGGGGAGSQRLVRNTVAEADIAAVISRWTGIPVTKLVASERERLLGLQVGPEGGGWDQGRGRSCIIHRGSGSRHGEQGCRNILGSYRYGQPAPRNSILRTAYYQSA